MEIRVLALFAFWASPLLPQEGGIPVEFCAPGDWFCSEDGLEIVFESGTSTHPGPLEPGAEIPIEVVIEARSAQIQGYSWAVKHDPALLHLLPESVTTAGTIMDIEHPETPLGASHFNATHAVPGGFISAIVLALTEKRELPLGRDAICRAAYRVESAAPCTVIRFVHGQLGYPGSPPVALNITANGLSKQPRYLRHGLVGSGACAETCDDLADNDGDGLADCADPECSNAIVCGVEICDDGIDNDGNSKADCLDPSCASTFRCREVCADGIDNDRDALVDCEDLECSSDPACLEPPRPPEECSDGADNDEDSLVDCHDTECWVAQECLEPETCADGIDNDREGGTDCADRDCVGDPACPHLEVCGDGLDNDEDGDADCRDEDCRYEFPCREVCDDGIDNDEDGRVDCDDLICRWAPHCMEDCDDGIDNDGDGFVDALDRGCTGYGTVEQQGNPQFPHYIRGDADGSGRINVIDAVVTVQVVLGVAAPRFACPEALNANDDGGVNLTDALTLLRYVFLDGPGLAAPFPECGSHFTMGCSEPSPGC